jgi:hypothetical protein
MLGMVTPSNIADNDDRWLGQNVKPATLKGGATKGKRKKASRAKLRQHGGGAISKPMV